MFLLLAIGLAVLDVWLIFWVPGPGSYKSPIAVPVITLFLLVMIFAFFSQLMQRKLVEEMKSPGATAAPEVSVPDPVGVLPPMPPLAVLTGDRLPALSATAAELVARGQRTFYQAVVIHRNLILYLIATNLTVALLALAAGERSPLPVKMTMYLLAAVPLLWVVANPKRLPNTLTYLGWLALHATWVCLTLFVAGACIVTAAKAALEGRFHLGLAAPPLLMTVASVIYVRRLTSAVGRLRREVLSHPPLRLLFLWVFSSWERVNSLFLNLGATWRLLGPLQLLQGGAFVGSSGDVFRSARGRAPQLVAATPELVDARISKLPKTPSRWMCMYSTDMLLCGDQSWRYAVTKLLADTDLVLMDLCGFSRQNAGCIYEISLLIDKIDLRRFLLLIDETTDLDFVHSTLETAWAHLAPSSPNRQPDCGPVQLFRLEDEYVEDKISLMAAARNSAGLLHLLCAAATRGPRHLQEGHAPRRFIPLGGAP